LTFGALKGVVRNSTVIKHTKQKWEKKKLVKQINEKKYCSYYFFPLCMQHKVFTICENLRDSRLMCVNMLSLLLLLCVCVRVCECKLHIFSVHIWTYKSKFMFWTSIKSYTTKKGKKKYPVAILFAIFIIITKTTTTTATLSTKDNEKHSIA
jgi:hypothetical protein